LSAKLHHDFYCTQKGISGKLQSLLVASEFEKYAVYDLPQSGDIGTSKKSEEIASDFGIQRLRKRSCE
jgi:hypothetical protein